MIEGPTRVEAVHDGQQEGQQEGQTKTARVRDSNAAGIEDPTGRPTARGTLAGPASETNRRA